MSKKSYWIVNKYLDVYDSVFDEYYFNCPNCKLTTVIVMPNGQPIPPPNYCQHCGKRLYIKENKNETY